jgi:hypothetical protein
VWSVLAIRLLIPFSPSLANIYIEITPLSQNIEFKIPARDVEDFQLPSPLATPLSDTPDMFQAAEDSSAEHIIPTQRTITLNKILSII